MAFVGEKLEKIGGVVAWPRQCHERQHVFLRIQGYAVVDMAVHVYGQAGNRQQGTPGVDQMYCRLEGIVAGHGYLAGQGQGPVEPRFADHAAVNFDVELSVAFLRQRRRRFDAEAGKIRMGCGDAQVSPRVRANCKGDEAGIVKGNIISLTRLQLPGLVPAQFPEPCFLQDGRAGFYGVIGRSGLADKMQQALRKMYVRVCHNRTVLFWKTSISWYLL